MRAAVMGSPIAHSLSPHLHRAAYRELGLTDWRYDAFECDEATLPSLLRELRPVRGEKPGAKAGAERGERAGEGRGGKAGLGTDARAAGGPGAGLDAMAGEGRGQRAGEAPGAKADNASGANADAERGERAGQRRGDQADDGTSDGTGAKAADRAGDGAGTMAGEADAWAGLSLTMPLKRAILPLLDTVSDLAVAVGGANTVVFDGGAAHGDNTDVYGIERALAEAGVPAPRSATILGGGATACSALAALRGLGLYEATLVVRDPARAVETAGAAERLGVALSVQTFDKLDTALGADLVISTLPGGAADGHADRLAGVPALFDVVYSPWPTRAARAVEAAGGTVIGGFEMLLHQAVRQVELMTGRTDVPVAAMRAAGEAEIRRRATRTS